MATDIILRSVKAAALTHAEMDQNWESVARTVDIQTADYTIQVADQNKVIEADILDGVITLPPVATASGTDTDSFRVAVKNVQFSSLIVAADGGEVIEGFTSVTLLEDEIIEFSLSADASEWSIIGFYGPNLVGVTASADELNYNDITALGLAQASKTMTLDAAKGITGITSLEVDTLTIIDPLVGPITISGPLTVTGAFASPGIIDNAAVVGLTLTADGNSHKGDDISSFWGAGDYLDIRANGNSSFIRNTVGELAISNNALSGNLVLKTSNSGGTELLGLVVGGPTPLVKLYASGIIEAETVVGAFNVVNQLQIGGNNQPTDFTRTGSRLDITGVRVV